MSALNTVLHAKDLSVTLHADEPEQAMALIIQF